MEIMTNNKDDGSNSNNKSTNPTSPKRPRRNNDDTIVWDALKRWIVTTPGGFCHDGLRLDDNRTLMAIHDIPQDTNVMIIPMACTVTAPQEWQYKVQQATANNNIQWHHPIDDLLVAWNLVVQRRTKTSFFQVYWDSLPAPETVRAALPRAWPVEVQNACLQGSPLLRRVHRQSIHLRNDYESLLHIMESEQSEDKMKKGGATEQVISPLSPSWNEFDQAMAIVTSRAFAGPAVDVSKNETSTAISKTTPTTTVCCIPLLDLGNHIRGNKAKPNLRYAWNDTGDCMVVYTRHAVSAGTPLSLTYGAQSNAQLLLNYGFCLPDNVEPDGSSNNTYELYLPSDDSRKVTKNDDDDDDGYRNHRQDTPIILRLGPKSYTYGPLVQVLQALSPSSQSIRHSDIEIAKNSNGNQEDEEDDMEAFLNGCEAEESDGEEGEDVEAYLYMGATATGRPNDEGGGNIDDDEVEQQKAVDLQALGKFQDHLVNRLDAYPAGSVDQPNDPRTQYAQLLVESEKDILRFYLVAVRRLLTQLDHDASTVTPPLDDAQVQQHVDSLVEAFFQIRYSVI
jgi:hypothetical protein